MCALLFGKAPTQEKQAPCIDDAVRYAGAVRTLARLRAGRGITAASEAAGGDRFPS